MSPVLPIIGGLILILGAYFTYKGDIFKSVMTYLVADMIWVSMAFSVGNIVGACLILFGAGLGVLAFMKMQKGEYRKTIRKN
jgi:hypothetical protein